MVKIAFNSPFAQKDEPKKEAAEALVADKVRGAGYLRCREEGGRGTAAGRSGAGGGGEAAAAAIFSQRLRVGGRQPAVCGASGALGGSPPPLPSALGQLSSVGEAARRFLPRGGGARGRSLPSGPPR